MSTCQDTINFDEWKNGNELENQSGREDWRGWIELATEAVNEIATLNTARVILDLHAQIMIMVERSTLALS